MDTVEDQDILLQRAGASYLKELSSSLPKFLFSQSKANGNFKARRHVRFAATSKITKLLEPFQEWPQLLDPQLQHFVSLLAQALLESSSQEAVHQPEQNSNGQLVIPLQQAVCKVLYTLFKIRGPKVISRLLNNEAGVLEPVLEKLEAAIEFSEEEGAKPVGDWEERYCLMLWLSHLLFAPFDLSTVGSPEPARRQLPSGLRLPSELPNIVVRLIGVSAMYICSPGKERESAVKLLSRLAARPDMLNLRLHDSLIQWSLCSLRDITNATELSSPYQPIGYLSLLAALLAAIESSRLEQYIVPVFRDVISLASTEQSDSAGITSSAVARKTVVKLLRVLSLSALQLSNSDLLDEILEEVVDHLLSSLADNDTPVRQSASKALSAIAAKLPPEMAAEIVEAVVGSLQENVLWSEGDGIPKASTSKREECKVRSRDFSAVNALRWHGLVLTLSQLLFQRSAPLAQLYSVLDALLLALRFEKRTTFGTSLGGNVRDAANFGIWSIARKYTTDELLSVKTPLSETSISTDGVQSPSTIQAIASELVVAACLDLSGNIRRGSSAALQELIGRHPNTIIEGITLVQVVDYHAVALRSRAVLEVALSASKLDRVYWYSVIDALFGWRGLTAAEASTRRLAANALGSLASVYEPDSFSILTSAVDWQIESLLASNVESRHGLFLGAAALAQRACQIEADAVQPFQLWHILRPDAVFHEKQLSSSTMRPELTAEAVCEVIGSFFAASSPSSSNGIVKLPPSEVVSACGGYVNISLRRREERVLHSAAKAATELFQYGDSQSRERLINDWQRAILIRIEAGGGTGNCDGYLTALSTVYNVEHSSQENSLRSRIMNIFVGVLRRDSRADIDTKVIALKGVKDGIIERVDALDSDLVNILGVSLRDYTIDQRGDIGSLAREEAVAAVHKAARRGLIKESHTELIALVTILAAEKLDRIRFAAFECLCECHAILGPVTLTASLFQTIGQTSGVQYYKELLRLLEVSWLRRSLLQGLVISIGTGSESVLRASRTALSQYCIAATNEDLQDLATTLLSLLRHNLEEDRLAVPILETWAYLFQSHLISNLQHTPEFSFKRLFVLVQKAHFRSGNLQKLTTAIEVYAGLTRIGEIKDEVVSKLETLLFHPLPKVRNNAADALYRQTGQEKFLPVDWSRPPKDLKKIWSAMSTKNE